MPAATRNPATANVKLDDEAMKTLGGIDKVREGYPDVRVPMEVVFGDTTEMSTLL